MAVVEMKRILLAAERQQKDAILLRLQQLGCVEVTPFEEAVDQESAADSPSIHMAEKTGQALARLRWAIGKLQRADPQKTSMFAAKPAASAGEMMPSAQTREEMAALLSELEALERRNGELKGRQTRIKTQMDQLAPWVALDIPMEDLRGGRSYQQFLGSLPAAALAPLQAQWADKPVVIRQISQDRDTVNIWAIVHHVNDEALESDLKEAGFTPAQLGEFTGTAKARHDALAAQMDAAQKEQADIDLELKAQAKHLPQLRIYHDAVQAEHDREVAAARVVDTRQAFLLRGWVPAPIEQAVLDVIAREFPGAVAQVTDPEPGDEPPVLLHNNAAVRPFEAVVEGYSLPAPGSLDPTALMAPFFACFFGMMVSDAGYGLMMMILTPLLLKMMKPSTSGKKLFLIIAIGGVFTLFWGIMYNTFFGFSPLERSVLDPIGRPLEVMVLCVAVGALHLLAGVMLGAVQNIRQGKYLDVIYDQLSWVMLLVGLGLLAVPGAAKIGQWVAIAGAAIILVFAGREKTRNPFKRLISGFGALYGVTSWLSDLLSYLRLFGMGLATGVIGMVFNILIGMVFSMGPIGWVLGAVLFVGCHLFNAGINILGAYVHAARLQYIEFFNKFYQEGGRAFKPLTNEPRFVRITDA